MNRQILVFCGLLIFRGLVEQGNAETFVNRFPRDDNGYDIRGVSVDASLTWTAANGPYVIESALSIATGGSLTIEEGTTVSLANGMHIHVTGTLVARGVTFQSLNAGQTWRGLFFGTGSDSSQLDRCTIQDAGGHLWILNHTDPETQLPREIRNSFAIPVVAASPRITDCLLKNLHDSAIGVYEGATPTISGNTFSNFARNNHYPVWIEDGDCFPVMGQNQSTGTGTHRVRLTANNDIRSSGTWSNPGIPYEITRFISIHNGGTDETTLTIEPGTQFECAGGGGISINSTLRINGTEAEPVEFRRYPGSETPDWIGLRFNNGSGDSRISHCRIRHAGARPIGTVNGQIHYASILCLDSSPTFTSLTLGDCENGMEILGGSPDISSSTFERIQGAAVRMGSQSAPGLDGITFRSNWVQGKPTGTGNLNITMTPDCDPDMKNFTFEDNFNQGCYISQGSLARDTTWEYIPGMPIVTANIIIPENTTLTIEDGCVIKPYDSSLTVQGTLVSQGHTRGISWTSWHDDTLAGDTNGDGEATSPGPGNWNGIIFRPTSSNSRVTGNRFFYSGDYLLIHMGSVVYTTLFMDGADPLIEGNQFHWTSSNVITTANSEAVIRNNSFHNIRNDSFAIAVWDLQAFPAMTGNSGQGSGRHAVRVPAGTILTQVNWSEPGLPWHVSGNLNIGNAETTDASLVIAPGSRIEISGSGIYVHGTLMARGTNDSPIEFNGVGEAPLPGSWRGIYLGPQAGNSRLHHCHVFNGGNYLATISGSVEYASMIVDGSSPELVRTSISHSSTDGLQIYNSNMSLTDCAFISNAKHALELSDSSRPTLDRVQFEGNSTTSRHSVILSDPSSDPDLQAVSFTGNGRSFIEIENGSISADTLWERCGDNIAYLLGQVSIPEGLTLSIEPGTVIKSTSGKVDVAGTLTSQGSEELPIIWTSQSDDEFAGDTNGDGITSIPAPANWRGIHFHPTSKDSVIENNIVRFGGDYLGIVDGSVIYASMVINRTSPRISGCRFDNSNADAISVWHGAPQISETTFHSLQQPSGYPVRIQTLDSFPLLNDLTVTGEARKYVYMNSGTVTESGTWNNPGIPYFMSGNIAVGLEAGPEVRLTVAPGTHLHFNGSSLLVHKTFHAVGTPDKRISFTTASQSPGPASWRGVYFGPQAGQSKLDYCTLTYGGNYLATIMGAVRYATIISDRSSPQLHSVEVKESGGDSIIFAGGSPILANSVVAKSAGSAIRILHGSTPIITSNTLAAGSGAGIKIDEGNPSVINNIIAFYTGEAIALPPSAQEISAFQGIHHNCAFSNGSNEAGPDGIGMDPEFAGAADGNYRLAGGSPAIDAGSSGDVVGHLPDFDGHARIHGNAVDLGAWEVGSKPVLEVVDLAVRSIGSETWTGENQTAPEKQSIAVVLPGSGTAEIGLKVSTSGLAPADVTLRSGTLPAGWRVEVRLLPVDETGSAMDISEGLQTPAGHTIKAMAPGMTRHLTAVIFHDGNATGDVAVTWNLEAVSDSGGRDVIQVDASTGGMAPEITTHPSAISLTSGQTLELVATASGTGPLTWQWNRNGEPVAGATGPTLTIPQVFVADSGSYTVTVTNSFGSATSEAALVSIETSGVVIRGIEFPGGLSSFADAVSDFDPLFSGGPAPTAAYSNTDEALGAPDDRHLTLGRGGRAVFQFLDNVLTGSGDDKPDLHIFEYGPDVEDTFVEISQDGINWIDIGKVLGGTSSIDIDAFGFGPDNQFAWVRLTDDPNEGGASGSTVGADIDAVGAIASTPAEFGILEQPGSAVVDEFDYLEIGVTPTGSGPFSWQWYFNDMPLCGETSQTLILPSVRQTQAGRYHVVVTQNNSEVIVSEASDIEVRPAGFSDSTLFYNGNIFAVGNNPTAPTIITLDHPTYVTRLENYHWNSGIGRKPGTIALVDGEGTTWGPWQTYGRCGQGGVIDAYWMAFPLIHLPAGNYTVVDSDPSTWSQNAGSEGRGFSWLHGTPSTDVLRITRQPQDTQTGFGQNVRLEVEAEGHELTYQWMKVLADGSMVPVDGGTNSNFTSEPILENMTFVVQVSNAGRSITSRQVRVSTDDREGSLNNPAPSTTSLTSYRADIGKIIYFTVTGSTSGSVWGTEIYTDDSALAKASIHAGVLTEGETGTVMVTLLPGQNSYTGSTQNGVTSSNWGSWISSYRVAAAPDANDGLRLRITASGEIITLSWLGGNPPFQVFETSTIDSLQWTPLGVATDERSLTLPAPASSKFYLVTEPPQ